MLDALVKSIYEARLSAPSEETVPEEPQDETVLEQSLDEETGLVNLPDIYFDTDSAEIKPEYAMRLQKSLVVIQAHPSQKIIIEGHTDSTHTQEYNLELSLRRALAVSEWLIEHGVAANRLETEPYCESRPVADNSTEEGRALNRRVEMVLQ